MAVPAHDERDWEFAKKFNLPIRQVVHRNVEQKAGHGVLAPLGSAFCEEGIANSSPPHGWRLNDLKLPKDQQRLPLDFSPPDINGLPTAEAKKKITDWLEEKNLGKKTINYKLRDWLFSRQRYWGEPFPIVWKIGPDGESYHEALPESALPVLPPTLEDYKPTATGEPPLARAKDWVNLPDGSVRETNTMPQWAGSCWYYLRYLDAKNSAAFVGSEVENYWMSGGVKLLNGEIVKSENNSTIQQFNNSTTTPGVDLYVGGTEHAVLHLLYARFWHKVLFDLGYVSTPEPFSSSSIRASYSARTDKKCPSRAATW